MDTPPMGLLEQVLRADLPTLKDQELAVLAGMVSGMRVADIAAASYLAPRTIRGHFASIREPVCVAVGVKPSDLLLGYWAGCHREDRLAGMLEAVEAGKLPAIVGRETTAEEVAAALSSTAADSSATTADNVAARVAARKSARLTQTRPDEEGKVVPEASRRKRRKP